MRVLLIAPRFVEKPGDFYEFPLGLCYIASCLKKAGHEVRGLNLNHVSGTVEEAVTKAVRGKSYDVVGTGGLSHHFKMVRSILTAVRKADPGVFTLAGGGLVSSEPELVCTAMEMDAGVIGEGEVTAAALIRALDEGGCLDEVPGIVHRQDGIPRITADRPLLENLDDAPWPDFELFDVRSYLDNQRPNDNYYTAIFDEPRVLPVISSRSCPYDCTFCYHPLGRKYRTRSIASVLEEIRHRVREYRVNVISLLDELFSLDRERVEEFSTGMAELGLKWISQMRVDRVDREILRRLRHSGLYYISYGIESASQAILKSMRKRTRVEQIERALAITAEERIGIQGNLLFGDPAETRETAEQSLQWARRNACYGLNMNYVIPYPGSNIYETGLGTGTIPDKLAYLEAGCPQVNLTGLGQDDLRWLRNEMMRTQAENRIWAREESANAMPGKNHLSEFQAVCPHCGRRNLYRNFRVDSIAVAKVACRHCMQRFDYRTSIFPAYAALLRNMRALAAPCDGRTKRVSIAPSMADPTFLEYLGFLDLRPEDLDIHLVFDNRPELHGALQLGSVPILPRNPATIARAEGDLFLVLPCPYHERIVEDLTESFGVQEERIIHLHRTGSKGPSPMDSISGAPA